MTIYSSFPYQGPPRSISTSTSNGIRLALDQVRHRVGRFELRYVRLDDSSVQAANWTPEATSANARRAAQEGQGYPPGFFTEREREIVRDYQRTPEYKRSLDQTRLERLAREAGTTTLEAPSGGFDWGDAGIGAAGMLALFSIGAGSTLLLTNRRRRRGLQVTAP